MSGWFIALKRVACRSRPLCELLQKSLNSAGMCDPGGADFRKVANSGKIPSGRKKEGVLSGGFLAGVHDAGELRRLFMASE